MIEEKLKQLKSMLKDADKDMLETLKIDAEQDKDFLDDIVWSYEALIDEIEEKLEKLKDSQESRKTNK